MDAFKQSAHSTFSLRPIMMPQPFFNESLTVQTPNSTYDCDVVSPSSNDGIKLSLIRHSREFHAARKVQSSVGKHHDAYTNVHPIHILRTMQTVWLKMRPFFGILRCSPADLPVSAIAGSYCPSGLYPTATTSYARTTQSLPAGRTSTASGEDRPLANQSSASITMYCAGTGTDNGSFFGTASARTNQSLPAGTTSTANGEDWPLANQISASITISCAGTGTDNG